MAVGGASKSSSSSSSRSSSADRSRDSSSAKDSSKANDSKSSDAASEAKSATAAAETKAATATAEAEEAQRAAEVAEPTPTDPRDRARAASALSGVDRASVEARLDGQSPMSVNRTAVDATSGVMAGGRMQAPGTPVAATNIDNRSSSVVDNGDGTSTFSAERERSSKLGGGVNVGVADVGAEVQAGTQQSYELTGPSDAVNAVADGTAPRPEMWDPQSIPVGGKLTVTDQGSQSAEVGAGVGLATAETERQTTEGMSYSVERLAEDRVRVSATELDGKTDATMVGAATGPFEGGVVGERNFDVADTQTADMDLSTPAGQQAYRDFLDTGRVPDAAAPGVTPVEARTSVDLSNSASLKFNQLSHQFAGHQFQVDGTVRPDGSRDRSATVGFGELSMTASATAAPGASDADLSARIGLDNVDGQIAMDLRTTAGLDRRREPNGDRVQLARENVAEITLDEGQLEGLRDSARARIPDWETTRISETNHPLGLKLAQAETAAEVQGVLGAGLTLPGVAGETYGLTRELGWLSQNGQVPLDIGLSIVPRE